VVCLEVSRWRAKGACGTKLLVVSHSGEPSLQRLSELNRAAVLGYDPGELTAEESAAFQQMCSEIEANPGRTWWPVTDTI
jgi:hypothetical protein